MAKVKIHPPLDSSHSPFKRMAKIGPGPRKRPEIKAVGKYECTKGKRVKKGGKIYHVQKCTVLATGAVRTIKTKKEWKDEYNKEYAKKRTRSAATNKYRAGYKR